MSKTNYNCIKIAPNACVDAYEYITNVVLPPRKGGYYLSFQRCCRNGSIVNLINPLSVGENIWNKINDTLDIGINSSPEFQNLPPNFLCTNAPLVFDHSAIDPDGDSLVYEFFHPYTGANSPNPRPACNQYQEPPFSQVNFESGYSYNVAIPSNPVVSLDRQTGVLKIVPTLAGQFVVGIVVKEFRNGRLIGSTQRDYQFNVQNCVFETTSAFVNPSVNCNREVFFTNNSQNALTYHWDFGDSTTINDTSNLKDGYYRYAVPGTYLVKLLASNGNCTDSIIKQVTVFDRIGFHLPPDTVICDGQVLRIAPDTFYVAANYMWNTGHVDSTLNVASTGVYWLNVQLGNCNTYDTINVLPDILSVNLNSIDIICDPDLLEFKGMVKIEGDYKFINWDSDPKGLIIPNLHDPSIHVSKKGTYWVYGVKNNGCPFADSVSIEGAEMDDYFKIGNVFTPNGDAFNEAFPAVKPPYDYKLIIYDRWGIQIFEGENSPWFATEFADGMYFYFIQMKACETEVNTHGVVHVIHGTP
ncbi:MAG: gliding motility-associated C-terminal domain-containing protein [Bacteroidia bacterium]|nr:gliding motility-associated C-terminal domain-containing protein [Bacteroidia bacterium]